MLKITPETVSGLAAPAQQKFNIRLCALLTHAVPEHMLSLEPEARQQRTDALVAEAQRHALVSERDVTRFAQLTLEEGQAVAERLSAWRAARPERSASDLLTFVEREFHTLA